MNYNLLLLAHTVCADRQIHNEEARALYELAKCVDADKETVDEIEAILSQDEQCLKLEEVAARIQPSQRQEALRQVIAIAYADGYLSPLEKNLINTLASPSLWNISSTQVEDIIANAERGVIRECSGTVETTRDISFGAKVLRGAESILSRNLIGKIADLAPEDIGRTIKKLQREVLLAGPEYDEAIQRCSLIASEDYKFTLNILANSEKDLEELKQKISVKIEAFAKQQSNASVGSAKDAIKQIQSTSHTLESEIIKLIQAIRESLDAKERALSYFSITFMGKTKAGKSTLHAIITGEGWEAIGVGKQRTTRLNRVYEWKKIRIIDTPGIGAPGGKTDEEVAESIMDESDIICYVVTNDSIQETEFSFLSKLKSSAKPLIILLNLKNNLRDSRRLEHFLANPNKMFAMEGKNDLKGHIDRIRRYAQSHYVNDYFDVIPVMLLAAQMSKEDVYQDKASALFEASRLQDFLDSIRESVVKHGSLRRSQTFLGSTVGSIQKPLNWLGNEIASYQTLIGSLRDKHSTIKKELARQKQDTKRFLDAKVKSIFQEAMQKVSSYARNSYSKEQEVITREWSEQITKLNLQERVNSAVKLGSERYNQAISAILEETGKEMQLMVQLTSASSFNFENTYSSFSLKIGGQILTVAGILLTFVVPPLGGLAVLAGRVMGLFSRFTKSDEERKREAINKLENALKESVQKQEEDTLKQVDEVYSKQCSKIEKGINTYFESLIYGLETILSELRSTQLRLHSKCDILNKAYGKRILDHALGKYESLSTNAISAAIDSVNRDFGSRIVITIKPNFSISRRLFDPKFQKELSSLLQENIQFNEMKLSRNNT